MSVLDYFPFKLAPPSGRICGVQLPVSVTDIRTTALTKTFIHGVKYV